MIRNLVDREPDAIADARAGEVSVRLKRSAPSSLAKDHYDGCLESSSGNIFVQIERTSTMRDVRGALLGLAYALHQNRNRRVGSSASSTRPRAIAVLVLSGSRVKASTLEHELRQFRAVSSKELGPRIFAVMAEDDGRVDGRQLPPEAPKRLPGFIAQLLKTKSDPAARVGRVTRQSIKATMLESYLAGTSYSERMPHTVADLQRASSASYPTVASALKELAAKRALGANGVQLLRPDPDLWRSIADGHAAERRTTRFIDPTGQAMRPERMLAALRTIQNKRLEKSVDGQSGFKIAVGGVLGAKMLYPGLDITAAMRLDLCVFDSDETFVRDLDPGLVPTADPLAQPVLVLHFTRDVRVAAQRLGRGIAGSGSVKLGHLDSASAIDCYADLLEMGYAGEARDFAIAMTRRAVQPSDPSR